MGVAVVVIYDSEVPGECRYSGISHGRNVAAAAPRLDEIAEAKGLQPFSRFIPDDDIEAFLADDPDLRHLVQDDSALDDSDLDEEPVSDSKIAEPPELWFAATDALTLLGVLIETLRSEPAWAEGRPKGWVTEIAESLDRLRSDLEVADKAGARFCLHYT